MNVFTCSDRPWAHPPSYTVGTRLFPRLKRSGVVLRPIHTYHAVPMLFPCHAVPLRIQNVPLPFDLHSAAVSDSHLSCNTRAMLRPCRSSQGHGTARRPREGLWATCPRSASSGYHAEFHECCYQKHNNLRCRWPVRNQTTFVMDEEKIGTSTLQKKKRSVKLLD